MQYREIEDVNRIATLQKIFTDSLQQHYIHHETRRIGYPGGHADKDVYFLEENREDSLWYISWPGVKGNKMITLLGHGTYGSNDWLSIDVQFNYPLGKFHRRMGAAFLEDVITGDVFLAHRGIVTLGQRVPKDKILEAMAAEVFEAENSQRIDEYMLVAPLSSATLVDDLSKFSRRLRNAIRNLGEDSEIAVDTEDEANGEDDSVEIDGPSAAGITRKGAAGLQDYFKEFSGNRRAYIPKKSFPTSYHGKVVHALHEEMVQRGATLKSRAIDLVANFAEVAVLFEVKTKSDSQSIYTAVGQLAVHSPTVSQILEKNVKKVLVVPESPEEMLGCIIENDLGIQVVTYTISAQEKIKFFGLDKIFALL
ncbi:hypothetical protein ACL58G_04575 [Massilia sp. GER05]|uniref:hypothetical protein n=1 Tax=Massilia sp. GER05 TaxID=3394605 RepID=UPI003F82ACF6